MAPKRAWYTTEEIVLSPYTRESLRKAACIVSTAGNGKWEEIGCSADISPVCLVQFTLSIKTGDNRLRRCFLYADASACLFVEGDNTNLNNRNK